jgi:hypothetical protein
MAQTVCPFCFRRINSSRLWFQCLGQGNVECTKEVDEARVRLTGSKAETFPTFPMPSDRSENRLSSGPASAPCPKCGYKARRRACPECHTALPNELTGSTNAMIGLVGARGSGKTVLMTVAVKELRRNVGRRFGASIQLIADNPDGFTSRSAYQDGREASLYDRGNLPPQTELLAARDGHATPVVLRWQQEKARLFGGNAPDSTLMSFVDTAGEDLGDQDTAFTLKYLAVCDALMITLDPFALPGARARLNLPSAAILVGEDTPLDVVSHITEVLKVEHEVRRRRRIKIPIAVVFTKIDAFYSGLDRGNPIMSTAGLMPAYNNGDGAAVHEHMLALLHEWGASDIDAHMRLNYDDYRYFGVSALGAEPDYVGGMVAPGGVQPHRVEDPLLWLLSKTKTVPVA